MTNTPVVGSCPRCSKQRHLVGCKRCCFICGTYQAFWGALWKAFYSTDEEEGDLPELGNRFMVHFYQMLTQRLAIAEPSLRDELINAFDEDWLKDDSAWDDDYRDVIDRLGL